MDWEVRMNAKVLAALAVPLCLAACGGGGVSTVSTSARTSNTPVNTSIASNSPRTCSTNDLSARLGASGAAAGSSYAPIVFTNTSRSACTLFGYPGVSYVAANGKQVGAAASRNKEHAAATVTLRPGGKASALLQMTNPANYPKSACVPTRVSGLRIYPPGNKTAMSIRFRSAQTACSTRVNQLSVAAIVAGSTGQ
jgi:hypothetical protein